MCAGWNTPIVKQSWCVLGVLVSVAAQGVVVGYTSFLLSAVREPNPDLSVDLHLVALLASCLGPSFLAGQIISCSLIDMIGRRRTFIFVQMTGIVGWPLIYFARAYPTLLAGRLLSALGTGCVAGLAPIVIAEYTDPKHRGMFLCLEMASFNLGTTITHTVLGYYFDWRTIALLATVPYIAAAAIALSWPESPAWLASKREYEQCRRHFFRLRGRTDSSVWEVEELVAAQKEQAVQNKNVTIAAKLKCFFEKFTQKDFLKPLLILVFGRFLIEACGRHFFFAYAVNIMTDITGSSTDQRNYTLVLEILSTVSAVAAAPLFKAFRRRTLLFFSGISSLVVLVPTCIMLYLISSEKLSRDYQLIPISLLILFFVLVNVGCNPVPLILKGELFPLRHRSAATACCALLAFVFLTPILHFTPFSLLYLQVHGTFAVCGAVMSAALLALHVTLPETKDRTLQEVEDYFRKGRFGTTRVPKDEALLKMIVAEDK